MKLNFNDVFELQMGKTPSRKNSSYWNGTESWISISDLKDKFITSTKEKITTIAIKETGMKSVPKDTVIMSFKLSIGKVAITTKDYYTNEAIMAFINKGHYDIAPEYLYYYLMSQNWDEISNKAAKGKTLNKALLEKTSIFIPTVSKQNKIVKILNKVQCIISLRKQQLTALDTLIKARFVEMFGDLEFNSKNWIKAPMGEYITVLTDFSANGSYEYLDSNVRMYDEPNYALMVRTTDLEQQNFTDAVKYIDENAYKLLSKSKVFGGEIIMNKIGSAGKIYLMPYLNKPVSLGRNAFLFRYTDDINVIFLYHLLISEYGNTEIMQHVRGAVTKTITKEAARSIKIFVPPIDLQTRFASFVAQIDKSKFVPNSTILTYHI